MRFWVSFVFYFEYKYLTTTGHFSEASWELPMLSSKQCPIRRQNLRLKKTFNCFWSDLKSSCMWNSSAHSFIFIRPRSNDWIALSLAQSLTNWCCNKPIIFSWKGWKGLGAESELPNLISKFSKGGILVNILKGLSLCYISLFFECWQLGNLLVRGKMKAVCGDLGHCSLLFISDPNAVYLSPKEQYFILVLNFELQTCKSNILLK